MASLENNIDEVRKEALQMLATIEAVRGKPYRQLVQTILLIHQSASIAGHMVEMIGPADPKAAQRMGDAMYQALKAITIKVNALSGVTDQEWEEAMNDAQSIDESVTGLLNTAAERAGQGFGNAE